ncbi:hypothetical protein AB0J90_02100 [Micromonospora sp. NPDC049523]|uniref:hypothetical protein n=1 Tax=Micromonospora sp. NPDC049523 TaxID=3155921 RepID=UPI00341DC6B8
MVAELHLHAPEPESGGGERVEGTAMFSWLGTPTSGGPDWPPPDRRHDHRFARRRVSVWSLLALGSHPASELPLRPTVGLHWRYGTGVLGTRRRLSRLLARRSARPRSEFPMMPAVGRQVRW